MWTSFLIHSDPYPHSFLTVSLFSRSLGIYYQHHRDFIEAFGLEVFFHDLTTELVMRRRRVMLASKWQVNLIYKGHKVFQFLPLHFIAESAIEYLATLLVREFACLLFVSGRSGAVLSIETPGITVTVNKNS